MRILPCALLALVVGRLAACGDPVDEETDCLVRIDSVSIAGDQMTAVGRFVTATPRLVFTGAGAGAIPGRNVVEDSAVFDISSLLPGGYDYSFDAVCFDDRDSPMVTAPSGHFDRP